MASNRTHRSPLFGALKRAANIAALIETHSTDELESRVADRDRLKLRLGPNRLCHNSIGISRRTFLKASVALSGVATIAGLPFLGRASSALQPEIAIVGAGIAGLTTALYLQKAGLKSTLFEASNRVGGRIFSGRGLVGSGLVTELGGEFIDSGHEDILRMVKALKLELTDLEQSPTQRHAYFIHGRHYTEQEVVKAFTEIVPRLKKDFASLAIPGDSFVPHLGYKNPSVGFDLDQLSIDEYLESLEMQHWLKVILKSAYTTEYGLDTSDQSALNLLTLIGTETPNDRFEIFGSSDERFRIKGGNDALTNGMAKHLTSEIQFEHRLESIRSRGQGFTLSFAQDSGAPREVKADIVILTVPFSVLRGIDTQIEMSEIKKRSINELGYGTNAKLIAGFTSAPWRTQGFSGYTFTDESFLTGWESANKETSGASGFTMLLGGREGVESRDGTPKYQAEKLLPGLERIYPGSSLAYANVATLYHWPSNANSLGCYACYRPGQWTSIGGAEIEPIGNLYFAGEHCSYDFQGFMNGGAETGRIVAEQIVKFVK